MKYLYSFCLLLLMSVGAFAQADGLSVKRFDDVSTIKQYARTQPKRDSNGDYAALVLVQVLADVKVDFTGAYLLGDVEKKASEYWVYMAAGAKSLEVHCTGFEKLKVDFADVSKGAVPSLVKQCTYELVVSVPGVVHVTQTPQRQFFKFRVTPTNAVVTIVENGAQEILPMRDGGIASKMLNYGTYNYSIAADKYHTKEGSFTVSATQTEMAVDLLPQFGWLTIAGDNISHGGYVFAANTATGGMSQLGTIPLNKKEMSSGVYTLRIQKEKYKDYSTTITIEEGRTTTLQPMLEANFAQVTLTAHEGADIYVDGNRLGTTRWTGTLELGDHSVETRQTSHHTAYTNVRVTSQSAGHTIMLNNPLPIYGSLIVDGSPADATVYVDGKKMGTSPLFISELLIGNHIVRVEKDGFVQQEHSVTIIEGKESVLDFSLGKLTFLKVDKTSVIAPASGLTVYLTVTCDKNWVIQYPSGSMYSAKRIGNLVEVIVNSNPTLSPRTAFFNIRTTDGSDCVKISLSQLDAKDKSHSNHYSSTLNNKAKTRSKLEKNTYKSIYNQYMTYCGNREWLIGGFRGGVCTGAFFSFRAFGFRFGPVCINLVDIAMDYGFIKHHGEEYGDFRGIYTPSVEFLVPFQRDAAFFFGGGPAIVYTSLFDDQCVVWADVSAGIHWQWGDWASSDFFARYNGNFILGLSIQWSWPF